MTGVPSASFDALVIAQELTASGDGVTSTEVHVFAYLACLLAMYDGHSPPWWDYQFVGTKIGAPYSAMLADAVDLLTATGSLQQSAGVLSISKRGRDDIAALSIFDSYAPRTRYLEAACQCALTIPLASLGEILRAEPQLRSAVSLMQSRELLDEMGVALLETHFAAVRRALADVGSEAAYSDLMIPATVWLTYLSDEANVRAVP
jgi:hypothetical protein